MVRSQVMLWTAVLVAALLADGAAANCGSRCTDTTFRAYTSCLQNCGANVAVTNCDCSGVACGRCSGENPCCQSCCNPKQCDCSNVNCQQPCKNACCSSCCQQSQQQSQCACSNVNCQKPCDNACCSSCCQQSQQPSQCGNCAPGCQQQGSACAPCCQQSTPSPTTSPERIQYLPPQSPPIYVNVSLPPSPPNVVNVSPANITVNPAGITVFPPNISLTPQITVIINTSPVSQVYPYQYAGNVSLSVQQQPAPALNCTSGQRRCCRVMMAPQYPCQPGVNCPPPVQRVGCGDQCAAITQQPMYYQPAPRPAYSYYPVYYYRPTYVYVPQTPQYFCSSGCVPTPTWPFGQCYGGAGSGAVPYSGGAASVSVPYSGGAGSVSVPYSGGAGSGVVPYSTAGMAPMAQYGNLNFAAGGAQGYP